MSFEVNVHSKIANSLLFPCPLVVIYVLFDKLKKSMTSFRKKSKEFEYVLCVSKQIEVFT